MHDGMGAIVNYVGGLPGYSRRNVFSGHQTLLAVEPEELVIRHAYLGGFWSTWRYEILRATRWEDVISLRFEESGQRSVNVAAVAAFGALAAGSGTNTTLITATFEDATVYLTTGAPLYEWASMREQLRSHQYIFERVHIGPPPEDSVTEPRADDVVGKLAQLAQMRAAGQLSDEEFAAAKASVLGA